MKMRIKKQEKTSRIEKANFKRNQVLKRNNPNGQKVSESDDDCDNFHIEDKQVHNVLQYTWKKGVKTGPGLSNLGNTCFMNSVLQCLAHTIPLSNLMLEDCHRKICNKKTQKEFCGLCFWETHIKDSFKDKVACLSPKQLFTNLKSISNDLKPGQQHDAHEFLINFLDNLERGYDLSATSATKVIPKTKFNPINSIFNGELISQVKCLKCGYHSDTSEPYSN